MKAPFRAVWQDPSVRLRGSSTSFSQERKPFSQALWFLGTIPAPRKEWLRAGVPSGSAAGSPQALVRRARGPAPSFSAGTAIFQVGPARGSRRPACHRRERQRGGRGGRALGFWRDCPVCFGPAGLGGGAMSVRGGLGPGPRGRRPGSDAAALLWGHAAEAPGRDTCFCDVFGVVS